MKSLLFIVFYLAFLISCTQNKSATDNYIELIPLNPEEPVKNQLLMDEINGYKGELEKLAKTRSDVLEDISEQN